MHSDSIVRLNGPVCDEFAKLVCILNVCRLEASPQWVALTSRLLKCIVLESHIEVRVQWVRGPLLTPEIIVNPRLHTLALLGVLSKAGLGLTRDSVATSRLLQVG